MQMPWYKMAFQHSCHGGWSYWGVGNCRQVLGCADFAANPTELSQNQVGTSQRASHQPNFYMFSDLRVPHNCSDSVTGPQWCVENNVGHPRAGSTNRPGWWDVYLDLEICHQTNFWLRPHICSE